MNFAENLNLIQQRIAAACVRAGRDEKSVTLLAVSKTHPPETIRAAMECGQLLFGENKIQEAKSKIPLCPGKARWQFIGHLQSNKVRDAVQLFEMIQGVDSLAIAQEISKRAEQAAKTMPILLEVNVAGGFAAPPCMLPSIPPFATVPEKARPYFKKLRELKLQCEQILGAPLPQLSMGMSGDFEVAIEEGATLVRVGTALFGERVSNVRKEAE